MAIERIDGKIEVRNTSGTSARITLNGDSGNITAGAPDADGDLVLRGIIPVPGGGSRAVDRICLDAEKAAIWLGGNDADGDIVIFPKDATNRGSSSNLNEATIHLDGDAGDIKLMGADCAEYFAVADSRDVEPGSVLVVVEEGTVGECREAYDRRVVGVASGAGALKPGIVLNRKSAMGRTAPVALAGTVFCKVDARYAGVETGDLLTTSSTPGHAMKAVDTNKSFGAVVGKALGRLEAGQGLIPVLVMLR